MTYTLTPREREAQRLLQTYGMGEADPTTRLARDMGITVSRARAYKSAIVKKVRAYDDYVLSHGQPPEEYIIKPRLRA